MSIFITGGKKSLKSFRKDTLIAQGFGNYAWEIIITDNPNFILVAGPWILYKLLGELKFIFFQIRSSFLHSRQRVLVWEFNKALVVVARCLSQMKLAKREQHL